jgi:L-lactate dehydrogenase (cytochrome)
MNPLKSIASVVRFKRFEANPSLRRLAKAASVADLRRLAQRRLPRGVFDYIDGGAEDERTLSDNVSAFANVSFRPRVLRGLSDVRIGSSILGKALEYPLILAPTGFTRIADPQGELAVARSAARAGLPYTLSTLSTRSIEEVRSVSDGRLWFQVYAWRDRGLLKEMIDRAAAARFEALVLTVDTAVLGRRERDIRHGFSLPPTIGLKTIVDGVLHPSWTWSFIRSEPIRFANVIGREVGDGASPVRLSDYINTQFDSGLSWRDVDWLRSVWDGPIVLKGVQTVEDARLAVKIGVEAIALSNHGGRQLDGAPAILGLVAPVSDAVGGEIEIICDGGIRRGSDIVKAVALGASAAMAGRAYLYGLGAAGEMGVDRVLEWFRNDLIRTLNLIGVSSFEELDRTCLEFSPSAPPSLGINDGS